MNPTLKEFYSQDASFKALNKDRQIQLFNDWAEKKKLNVGLTFKERIDTKWPMRIYTVLAVIYFGTYFYIKERMYHSNLLIGLALIQLFLRQETPRLYGVGLGGARQPDNPPVKF